VIEDVPNLHKYSLNSVVMLYSVGIVAFYWKAIIQFLMLYLRKIME